MGLAMACFAFELKKILEDHYRIAYFIKWSNYIDRTATDEEGKFGITPID